MAKKSPSRLEREVQEVEKFELLLVRYLREISNQITYLMIIVSSIFLLILVDLGPQFLADTRVFDAARLVLVILIVGGFMLFAGSSSMKRKIEKRFEDVLR